MLPKDCLVILAEFCGAPEAVHLLGVCRRWRNLLWCQHVHVASGPGGTCVHVAGATGFPAMVAVCLSPSPTMSTIPPLPPLESIAVLDLRAIGFFNAAAHGGTVCRWAAAGIWAALPRVSHLRVNGGVGAPTIVGQTHWLHAIAQAGPRPRTLELCLGHARRPGPAPAMRTRWHHFAPALHLLLSGAGATRLQALCLDLTGVNGAPPTGLATCLSACKVLRDLRLDLLGCTAWAAPRALIDAITALPQLERLSLWGIDGWGTGAAQHLSSGSCPRLSHLRLGLAMGAAPPALSPPPPPGIREVAVWMSHGGAWVERLATAWAGVPRHKLTIAWPGAPVLEWDATDTHCRICLHPADRDHE